MSHLHNSFTNLRPYSMSNPNRFPAYHVAYDGITHESTPDSIMAHLIQTAQSYIAIYIALSFPG